MIKLSEKETLQSGDDIGDDITCHDCGEKFADGERTNSFVICTCGGRHANVIKID